MNSQWKLNKAWCICSKIICSKILSKTSNGINWCNGLQSKQQEIYKLGPFQASKSNEKEKTRAYDERILKKVQRNFTPVMMITEKKMGQEYLKFCSCLSNTISVNRSVNYSTAALFIRRKILKNLRTRLNKNSQCNRQFSVLKEIYQTSQYQGTMVRC